VSIIHNRIQEETYIFLSIIKWFFLATLIGLIGGATTFLFVKALNLSIQASNYFYYTFLLLPIVFFLNNLIVKKWEKESNEYTANNVIRSIHQAKDIRYPAVLKAFFLPILTIFAGGSAGKEAPAADIGAGVGSIIGKFMRLNKEDIRKLTVCGVSAGFSAVFGTPIAGAIFGVEVLFIGGLMYDIMLPSFLAGIVGFHTAKYLGLTYEYHPLHFTPVIGSSFFIKLLLAGLFFGLCSFLIVEIYRFSGKLSEKMGINAPLKGLIGGAFLIILTLLFSKAYLGLGLETVNLALEGQPVNWYDFILKTLFTVVTLTFGGIGGMVTPLFFIGSTAGSFFASVFGFDLATFAAIGLVAVLAGVTNTPIAASIMAIELFGPEIAPYAAIACIISYLMTGHRSIYPAQVLKTKKTEAIDVELGKDLLNTKTNFSRKLKYKKILSLIKAKFNSKKN